MTRCYKPLNFTIWQSLSNWIATPSGVDRTTFPSHFMRLRAPVVSLFQLIVKVNSSLKRVPSENGSVVSIKAPAEDISLVWNLNICFFPEMIISILVGSVSENLSYFRFSVIEKTFHFITKPWKHLSIRGYTFWAGEKMKKIIN